MRAAYLGDESLPELQLVMSEPALQLRDISGGYGHTTVLRGVNLTVPAASVTALLGPNGAGKTTLLKIVSGLLRPTSGSVLIDGEDVTKLSPSRRTARGVCHIPEGRGIFRGLTVRDNLIMQSAPGTEADAPWNGRPRSSRSSATGCSRRPER